MRIRSIKYNSATNHFIHQNQQPTHSFYSRVQILNTAASSSININPNPKHMFTQQCLNLEPVQPTQPLLAQKGSEVIMKDNYIAVRSQKIHTKNVSLYQATNFDKENRTSIFQAKNKELLRNLQSFSNHENNGPKIEKIRFNLSKFSAKNETELKIHLQKKNQIGVEEGIILGENLTYGIQSLESSVKEMQEQARKEKIKIQKIRKNFSVIGVKIQRQLDNILRDFKKNIQSINSYMSRQKAEKCTILVNWKSVINQKAHQYQQQSQMIDQISQCVQRVIVSIQDKQQCSTEVVGGDLENLDSQ